jgi:regulator of RNase E activity RraA
MIRAIAILLCACSAYAQLFTLSKDEMVRLTAKNPYGRFDDGRPNVPADVIEKLRAFSAEDVWTVLNGKGFTNQYDGNFRLLHPGKKMVGRVVTAQFMPVRPDLNEIITAGGKAANRHGGQNQWVIDRLQEGDVMVVDMFGKVENGTFVGGNLFYYISKVAGAGIVVDGAVRDLEEIADIPMPGYVRGVHPTAIRDVMLTGYNVPVRIGNTTVLPGDIAFGDREGVYFVPPQFAEEIIKRGDDTKIHDVWTKQKFDEKKYKSSDIYGRPHDPELIKEYEDYKKKQTAK